LKIIGLGFILAKWKIEHPVIQAGLCHTYKKITTMKIFIFPIETRGQKHIGIRTEHFDPACNALIKKIPRSHWNPGTKSWCIPYEKEVWRRCQESLAAFEIVKTDTRAPADKSAERNLPSDLQAEFDTYYTQLYVQRYSLNTIRTYCSSFKYFLYQCRSMHPKDWTLEDFKRWLRSEIEKNKWSEAYQNTIINALKFYFEKIRNEARAFWEVRPRRPIKLPGTLSLDEVNRLLNSCENLKHRTMLTLIYACGLRISELIKLRKADIDRGQKRILIKAGKGKKDRYVILPDRMALLMQKYLEIYPVRYGLLKARTEAPTVPGVCKPSFTGHCNVQELMHTLQCTPSGTPTPPICLKQE